MDQQLRLHGDPAHHASRPRAQRQRAHPLPGGPALLRLPLVPARQVPQQVSDHTTPHHISLFIPFFMSPIVMSVIVTRFQEELVPPCSGGVAQLAGGVQPAVQRGDELGDRQDDLQRQRSELHNSTQSVLGNLRQTIQSILIQRTDN